LNGHPLSRAVQSSGQIVIVNSPHLPECSDIMQGQPPNPEPTATAQRPTQPSTPPAPPRRKWYGMAEAGWDSICDMSFSPFNVYLKTEWPHIRNAVDLFILFIILGVVLGWLFRGHGVQSTILALKNDYSNTNAILTGQLMATSNEIQRIEKERDKIQQAGNNEMIRLTLDLNEAKRGRDADVLRLTGERDSLQQRLSYFESLPANVLTLYSNLSKLYANDPTNRQQLASMLMSLQSITNAINDLSARPTFDFYLNGIPITNGSVVVLHLTNDSTQLVFAVKNSGTSAADGVHILLDAGEHKDAVRIITSDFGWTRGISVNDLNGNLKGAQDEVFVADYSGVIAQRDYFTCSALHLRSTSQFLSTMNPCWMTATAKNGKTTRILFSVLLAK
jgi:hypothetical protein